MTIIPTRPMAALAVKSDVMVGMDLQTADYEKAKALMVAICSRL